MDNMGVVDIAILVIVLSSVIVGMFRGFVKESITIITWVLAAYLAYTYGENIGSIFSSSIDTVLIRQIIGGIIIFIAVLIAGGACNHIIGKLVKFSGFIIFDKFLGSGLGFIRGIAGILLVIPMLSTTVSEEDWWKNSVFIPKFQAAGEEILSRIPEEWMNRLNELSGSLAI